MAKTIEPIGFIKTPFKQKFGIPRQAHLAKSVKATIELVAPFNHPDCLKGVETFSHLWLTFAFHKNEGWSQLVRPPRLGGNLKMGVFATRSPFRPNGLGQSVVKLEKIEKGKLIVSGVDLLDETPIYDIKPYIHFTDSFPESDLGWINETEDIPNVEVKFDSKLDSFLEKHEELRNILEEILAQDPRPAYKPQDDTKSYNHEISGFEITWEFRKNHIYVTEIVSKST